MGKWKEVKLSEVYDVRDGTHDSPKYVPEGYPLVTSKNLKGNSVDLSNVKYISQDDYDAINKRSKVDIGDVLFAMIGTIGNPILIEEAPNYAIKNVALFKKKDLNQDSKFLTYYLGSERILDKMKSEAKGATQKFVGLTYLRNFKIPLPPLPEQQRIVAKLDGLFAKIDQAISLLEANLQHTQALMGSVLDEEFEKLEAKREKLENVVKIVGGGTPKTTISEYWADEIIWLSPTDLPPIGVISTVKDSTKKISRLGLQKSSAKLLPKGTVVYSSRASIGKIAITECELSTNQGFTNFIPNEGLNNVYLAKTLKHFTPKIEALSNSTTFKEVSKTALKKFEIPVPDYKTQLELSQLFSEYQNLIDKSVETQTQKLNHLKALKSSLLDQAFKGEL